MKATLLFTAMLFGMMSAHSQWMNASFENWQPNAEGFIAPFRWLTTNNVDYPDQIQRDTDAEDGNFAVRMLANGGTDHPAGISQEGDIDFAPTFVRYHVHGHMDADDYLIMECNVKDGFGNEVMSARDVVSSSDVQQGWTVREKAFELLTSGPVVRIDIRFYLLSDDQGSGHVSIDHVEASSAVSVTEATPTAHTTLDQVYFSQGALHLQFAAPQHETMWVQLFDLNGREVWSAQTVQSERTLIDVSDVPQGLYIVAVRWADTKESRAVQFGF